MGNKDSLAKILMAEDNPINQKFMGMLLTKAGYQHTSVNDGQEVLDILDKDLFDLLILDINLPVMDGLEIYNLVRARKSLDGVGVILLDAWGMRGSGWGKIIKEVQSNGDEIVLKPIDVRTFIGFVEKVLENHGKSHLIASKAL